MGAVPREEANIEVEGGETVVGDVNRDGFLEHMTFTGKRHSEGGMPVNIPEGSFIFSDTKKLKIKDKDVLEKVFGLSYKKEGYTPAEIAKRYQINNFIQDLKDPEADAITKRSATQMLDNNMQKLGMLALVQESMKGFPDGVPAIAESVMAGLQGEPTEQSSEMRKGGKVYQSGGPIKYTPNTVIYLNGVPFRYAKHENNWGWSAGDKITFKADDGSGRTYQVNSNKLGEILNKSSEGKYTETGISGDKYKRYYVGTTPENSPDYYSRNTTSKIANQTFKPNDIFYANGQQYKVVDANAVYKGTITTPGDEIVGLKTQEYNNPSIKVQKLDSKGNPVGGSFVLDPSVISSSVKTNTFDFTSMSNIKDGIPGPGDILKIDDNEDEKLKEPKKSTSPVNKARQPLKTQKPAGVSDGAWAAINSFKQGGAVLDQYQEAGTAKTERMDPNAEIPMGSYTHTNGEIFYRFYKGDQKIVKDKNGAVVLMVPRTDTQYSQYGSPNINQILAKTPNVRYTNVNFGTFGQQPRMGNTGIYLSSGNAQARKSGDLSAEEWQDFKDRHGDWIDKDYKGGFEKFKEHLLAGQATGDKAADWFQGKVNEKSRQQFGVDYFADPKAAGNNPYKRDSKFGQVTYSVPRFFDAPVESAPQKPNEEPKTPEVAVREDIAPLQPRRQGPWWLQDIVNFTGTLTDRVNRYEPTQGRVSLQTPGYVLEDPTRRLAANQEQMARLQEQAMNTTDGNVALASMLGATGQGFANAANVLGEVEGRNVNTVNQAYLNNAQIRNQETVANETGRQKYVEDMATLNQQMDNAEQQKKWRQIAAFNNGTTNWFRKKQMEQVLFPQVYVDPISGETEFSGQGRDLFGPNTYSPAYMGPNAAFSGINSNASLQAYTDAYNDALTMMTPEQAMIHANDVRKANLNQQTRMAASMGATPRQQYNQMALQGLTLPASQTGLPGQQYGGEMYLPWAELD
jgi:hypothetical protein